MSTSVIALDRAAVALEVGGEMVDISGGVRAARLSVTGRDAAYFTLETGWARQMDGGRRGVLLLAVVMDDGADSAYAHLRGWLLAGGARTVALTQGEIAFNGAFRLVALSPLAEARVGAGGPALAQARLALDGVLTVG